MTSFRIRPRFRSVAPMPEADIAAHLRAEATRLQPPPCVVAVTPGYIVLSIPPGEQHYWSPQLGLSLEAHEEGGTLIRGLYGPHPNIWAMFAFAYGALAILSLFVAILGFSAVALGQYAPILWALPLIGVTAAILYLIAQAGQKLGAEQTYRLHLFFEQAIGHRAVIE